jgi:aromatic ring-opening dioxygenase catalytic subunit (LigB family)
MGEIVGAGLVAHVPTIVLPEQERLDLNEGHEISLVPGLRDIRSAKMDPLGADTVIVVDSHWFTTVETVVTSASRRKGHFTSGELPRGMASVPYDLPGDPELAEAIASAADEIDQCWVTPISDPNLPVFYATVNVAQFLQRDEAWLSVSCAQTGEPIDFLNVGACIAKAVQQLDRRVVLLASGAMSHTFWSLRQLRSHEASDPKHVFSPQAVAADQVIIDSWSKGDHASVIDGMPGYLAFRPEARFAHYLTMVGALGGRDCRAVGEPFSEYENSIGTAQIHVWFDRPAGGWTS